MEKINISITKEEEEVRLDKFLESYGTLTRSQWKKRIEEGNVTVDGKLVKSGFPLKKGMIVTIIEKPPYKLKPVDLSLDILYEDRDIGVVDKPKGLVVHPGAGEEEKTLVHGLMYEMNTLAEGTEPLRPGIVHRLDKETEGLLVIAKTNEARDKLLKTFKEREVEKVYYALVHGHPKPKGEIETYYGRSDRDRKKMSVKDKGKIAITHYRVLQSFPKASLLEVHIITGRTHQIPVNLSHIGHHIIGDPIYVIKNSYGINSQMLVAK
ncbi:MAG: RluA family pseudouridine synthase, partial [Tissierellia bacterium]|nr:RluA family pseudouridine synthase [Tissierellia bacterium]